MLYRLNDEFSKINQTEGLMQNMTRNSEIEIIACVDNPQKDSGFILLPLEKLKFTAQTDESIYARCTKIDGTIANLSVVNFKMPVAGESGTGCACTSEIDDTVIVLDKTWSSEKINDTFTKYYTKTEIDNMLESVGSGTLNYVQVTKLGVIAPKTYELPIVTTNMFNLPPAEVLKFKPGKQDQIKTICDFDADDAKNFIIDGKSADQSKCYDFNGVLSTKTEYDVNVSDPVALLDGFICESEELDFRKFKKIAIFSNVQVHSKFKEYMALVPDIKENPDYGITAECSSVFAGRPECDAVGLFDDNIKRWYSAQIGINGQWISVDFGRNTVITAYSMDPTDCGIDFDGMNSWAFEGSLDKIDWIVLDQQSGHTAAVWKNTLLVTIPKSNYRYYRWRYISGNGNNYARAFGNQIYLNNYHFLYLKEDDSCYEIKNGVATQVSNNWNGLSDQDKKKIFLSAQQELAPAIELQDLGKFKVLTYLESDIQPRYVLKAIPKDHLIVPKELISLDNIEGVDKVTVKVNLSGQGTCKVIVTTNLETFQTLKDGVWVEIDHTDITAIAADGINAAQLSAITRIEWDALASGKGGIGFAYLPSIEDITDVCEIDKLELTVDMKGSWRKALHGTDYDYEYPTNNLLSVTLLTNGDYKINYCKE